MNNEIIDMVRRILPEDDMRKTKMMSKRKRRPCWSCPILRETDTIDVATVLQQLNIVMGNIRGLAHECKKRHEKLYGKGKR